MNQFLDYLPKDWSEIVLPNLPSDYLIALERNLQKEYSQSICYPKKENIFKAFQKTPWSELKVVILGQDPYFNEGEANGLAFSVNPETRIPPSLRNIFTELHQDLGVLPPTSGNLTHWAQQGILLLNASLTVRQGKAASHQHMDWTQFTDQVITQISEQKEGVIFVLWGKHAQKKKTLIQTQKNIVLESAHPSPLSAFRGFFGSKPFSTINKKLIENQQTPIDWLG